MAPPSAPESESPPNSRPVAKNAPQSRRPRTLDAAGVLAQLELRLAALQPGDLFPTHRELLAQLDASERAVLGALAELQRAGKIERVQGKGTFVAPPPAPHESAAQPESWSESPLWDNRTLLVLLPYHDGGYFDRFTELVFPLGRAAGFSLLCRVQDDSPLDIAVQAAAMAALPARGFLLLGWGMMELAGRLFQLGCRVVLIATPPPEYVSNVPLVYCDQDQGSYLALRHLIDLGHRRILVQGTGGLPQTRRFHGMQRAVAEARKSGIGIQLDVVEYRAMLAWTAGAEVMRQYLGGPDRATGLLAWNDSEAIELIAHFRGQGLRVPDDLSVVGCDNLPVSLANEPPLTTIDGQIQRQLEIALELLNGAEAGPQGQVCVVPPLLVVRASTAAPE